MTTTVTTDFSKYFSTLAHELGPVHTASFLKSMSVLELAAGRKLIRHRMPVDSIYLIVGGRVEVTLEEGQTSTKLNVLEPGEWLGEVSALSGDLTASATVTTQTPARFLRMRHETFENLITRDPAVANVLLPHMVLMLSDRLRKAYQREASLSQSKA